MRATIDLPESMLRDAKRQAAELNVTLSEVVQEALRRHLARRSVRDEGCFQLHTVRGRLVRPELELHRTSSLVTLDDESVYARDKR